MKALLAALLAAVVLSLFASGALLAAGDDWPNGGSVPPLAPVAGDDWPNGG